MNSENTGFAAFCLYNALKLHFTGSYDYLKYNGKTNVTKQSFLNRKDKYTFYKLSRKYRSEELQNFYVSNLIIDPSMWAGEMTEENFLAWKKINESLTYKFQQDVSMLFDKYSPQELVKVSDGQYPNLLIELMQGSITLETVVIIDRLIKVVPVWSKKIQEDIIWPSWEKKIVKYSPFVQFQEDKCKNILKEKVKQSAET